MLTDLHGVVDGGHDVPELLEQALNLPGLDVPLPLPQVGLLHTLQRLSVALGSKVVPGQGNIFIVLKTVQLTED